jgi:N-acetylmuramoyl-L-alanine amidase
VRKPLLLCISVYLVLAVAICASPKGRARAPRPATQVQPLTSPSNTQQPPISPTLPPIIAAPQTTPAPPPLTVVIDAAHGGADDGAKGANGINEKDVVLALARGCRAELTQRGYRVVMTRDSDADPTFDERAFMANQFANSVFVSLHVASTGTPGTVRVYYDRFAAPFTIAPTASPGAPPVTNTAQPPTTAPPNPALLPWRRAQASFDDQSHLFADLVQSALVQKFSGSPPASLPAAVRDLRSIAAPAIAIEISNIGSPNVSTLESMSPSVAAAIAQALTSFHPSQFMNGAAGGAH